MKTIYVIRAKNGDTPSDSDVYGTTHCEDEAKMMLEDARNAYDYCDVLINGKRYRVIF